MSEPFIGTILPCPYNFAPRYWAFCRGQTLDVSQQTTLFSLLSNIYGGDGQTTFCLPNLCARFPVGAGDGPGLSHYDLGHLGGHDEITLTVASLPAHSHVVESNLTGTIQATQDDGTTHDPSSGVRLAAPKTSVGNYRPQIYGSTNQDRSVAGGQVGGQVTCGTAGSGQALNIRTPLQAMNYIICMVGIYPSRN